MVKGQIFVDSMESMEKIDKAAYMISIIVQKPDIIRNVVFTDPFSKQTVFEDNNRKFALEIEFEDDGSIKEAFKNHIAEYENSLLRELERVKQEKSRYG